MRATWKCRSALVLAVAQIGWIGLASGCDTAAAKSRREAEQTLKYSSGGAADSQALTTLSQSDAVPAAVKASAKNLLAESEIDAARTKLRDVDLKEVQVIRLLGEIRSIAATVAANNAAAANYRALSTQASGTSKAGWEKLAATVQGSGGESDWVGGEGAKIPALSAAEAHAAQVKGEIDKLQAQLDQMMAERQAAAQKAAGLFRQTDQAKGTQAVTLFTQAWQSQKAATDLGAKASAVQAKLVVLNQQLMLAQQQQKIAQGAVEELKKQAAQAVASADSLNKVADAQVALSKSLVSAAEPAEAAMPATAPTTAEGSGEVTAAAAPPAQGFGLPHRSLTAKAADLAALTQSIRTGRQEAITLINSAITHYGEAQNLAGGVIQSMQQAGSSQNGPNPALTGLQDAFHKSTNTLQIANARLLLASIQQDAAHSLAARQELATYAGDALKAAGVAAPTGLVDPAIAQELQQAREDAEAQYSQVIDSVEPLEGGGGAGVAAQNGRNAYGLHGVALVGRSLLRRSLPTPDAAQKGDADLAAANNLIANHAQDAAFPHSLLVSLGVAPRIEVAPTTGPATAPTQPAPAGQ